VRPGTSDLSRAVIEAATRGDRAAVTALTQAFLPRVYGLTLRLLGRRDVAEDVTQEAFARALRALPDLRDRDRLGPWLLTIAANTAREHLRKAKREGPLEQEPPSKDDGGARDEALAARRRALDRAVETLDVDERELFLLHKVEGIRLKELAERENTSLPAMKSRVHRIAARVRVQALAHLERDVS
jgi:RNA polymerase sigma-70 factor, ECF subfamily